MSAQTKTAKVTTVKLGNLEIEGLLLEDGSFGIALQQVASLFSVIPTSAPKWLKTRLGNGFQLFQVKTDRPKQDGKQNRAENVLNINQFETLLRKLDREGNETARLMVDAMIGLSLTQLFCDAFNIKFDAAERQTWLLARSKGKATRRKLTDAIKEWYERNPTGTTRPQHAMYAQTTNLIYQRLWGMTAIELENLLGCQRNKSRDFLDEQSLKLLDRAEANVMDFIDLDNIKPVDAVPLANIRPAKMKPEP